MTKTGQILGWCVLAGMTAACGSEDAAAPQMGLPQTSQPLAGDNAPGPNLGDPLGNNMQQPPNAMMQPVAAPMQNNDMQMQQPGGNQPMVQDPSAQPSNDPSAMDMPDMMAVDEDPRGKCDIDSGYPDDAACLLPPPPDKGIQIHIGPKDYTNMAEVRPFLMMPGNENSECWTFHTPNTEDVTYQTFELSGRSGTHHIINTMYSSNLQDGGFTVCADPGIGTNAAIIDNLPGASKAYMPRGKVAPEDAHIGRSIPANTAAQADMHYFNLTDEPILREFWLNIYFAEGEVTEKADQIRGMGGLGWTIPAGADQVYKYECPISGDGRIMALLGHYHAHGTRFTASIRRAGSGQVEKVFEMYDYLDPAEFAYNSVDINPEFSDTQAGAISGPLEVSNGDVLMWECHIQNDSAVALDYSNNVETGEMCNLWGSSVGTAPIDCLRFF